MRNRISTGHTRSRVVTVLFLKFMAERKSVKKWEIGSIIKEILENNPTYP